MGAFCGIWAYSEGFWAYSEGLQAYLGDIQRDFGPILRDFGPNSCNLGHFAGFRTYSDTLKSKSLFGHI